MLRPYACLSILLLLSLLLHSCFPLEKQSPPVTIDDVYNAGDDSSAYINLTGKKIFKQKDDNNRKMIVLTTYARDNTIRQLIENEAVIDLPSSEALDSMEHAFERANEHKGKEQFFIIGKNGRISLIVEGTREEVDSVTTRIAKADLDQSKH